MNITSQTLINQKIKQTKSLPFQAISSSSSRLRLNDAKRVLNETIKPFETKSFKVENVLFYMICCPKGVFTMGADKNEQIEHPFLLGETEVTQELYQAVMGYNPSGFQTNGSKKPVENVNWYEAVIFCNKLSQMLGKRPYYRISKITPFSNIHIKYIDSAFVQTNENADGFRLPTEKEWEYAAKAGIDSKYSGCNSEADLKDFAWFWQGSDEETHNVRTKKPNRWGFYDMSGNVGEWCWDKSNPFFDDLSAFRVYRGGSWYSSASYLRSADRSSYSPGIRNVDLGFRVAASLVN